MAEMAGILKKFVSTKRDELRQKKLLKPYPELEGSVSTYQGNMLSNFLGREKVNIIAEIKYRSPSRGSFPLNLSPVEVANQYQENGAAAISVLTDMEHFGGDLSYLKDISESQVTIPLLRKDFIIDRYQVLEAGIAGAAAFLLIVACLEQQQISAFSLLGKELGMEALVEVHDEKELDIAMAAGARIIGVNNRNLDTLEVDINTSFRLAGKLEKEKGIILVSESGISEVSQIQELRSAGFDAFLIGTSLMNSGEPGRKLAELTGVGNVD